MLTATQGKEVVLKVRNEIGVIARMAKHVSEKGLNILATCAWTDGENGILRLVTDDNLRAVDILREKNFQPREQDVVIVTADHRSGMLRHLADQLASEGIDVHHIYASAPIDADTCLIVLATANNDRAVVLLNE